MIGLKVSVKRDPKMGKRRFENAMKKGFAAAGAEWHTKILPRGFEQGNWRRPGHKPRTRKYRERKKRLAQRGIVKKGGEADLVFSGAMETTMERFATIKAYPTRATVRVQAPRYMTVKPHKSNQPDKFKELSALTAPERKMFERTIHKTTEADMRN